MFYGEAPTCDRKLLENILDPVEAKRARLNIKTYCSCVRDICFNKVGKDRLTVIAFSKFDNHPIGLITFQKKGYDPTAIDTLPGNDVGSEVLQTTRKSLWENQYVVRSSEFKSKCLGDILMGCGLAALCDVVRGNRPLTINVWLIVSNSFSNTSALRLYLSYGFGVTGMYHSVLMMIVTDLNDTKIEKVKTLMKRQVECFFLLPDLKNRLLHSRPDQSTSSISHQQHNIQEVIFTSYFIEKPIQNPS